ncbi:MAG TPA: hypothetical protein VFJ16_24625 [Longimicrobium sp.]|nr:hypothetical protein [Longimicrobium sp.]
MRKIKLDLEQLAVESFSTAPVHPALKGTIRGNNTDIFPQNCPPSKQFPYTQNPGDPGYTIYGTCGGICGTDFCSDNCGLTQLCARTVGERTCGINDRCSDEYPCA